MRKSMDEKIKEAKTLGPNLYIRIRIEEGPVSYQTFSANDNVTATEADLFAAVQEDASRFREAWTQLADL